MSIATLAALWLSGVAGGCASFARETAADQTLAIVQQSVDAAAREPDLELARAALPAGLLQLAAFAAQYPDRPAFRALHADALCGYAAGFVFDDWDAAQVDEAPRLVALLERCVAENLARLPGRLTDDRAIAVATLTRADAPALLWIATARSVELALAPLRHLADLPRIEAMLRRSAELAPGLRDAAAEQLLGVLAAARPRLLGGDAGADAFARARRLAPGALMVDVQFARGTLVALGDRARFEQTLRAVLAADVTRWPAKRADNELARRKAARYLAAADRWFAR